MAEAFRGVLRNHQFTKATPAIVLPKKQEQHMHHIKPLSLVTREEVRLLAQAAAERDEPLDTANIFAHGSDHHRHFRCDFLQRQRALEALA